MLSLIMKAMKRTMAGEYSRELSAKVSEGLKRLARLGFKQGGLAGPRITNNHQRSTDPTPHAIQQATQSLQLRVPA